jgi:cellulose synthase/poly-beta-1,6-N-acetylglucosamine synthase-like glycosyltransferase
VNDKNLLVSVAKCLASDECAGHAPSHQFLAPAARFGWMPFIGHTALLRTSAVLSVGGLTPDFFSDDLDLTVRLNLARFRIAYAPDNEMGEKHPASYTAFHQRSYKWAYGCLQTLRAHWGNVLLSQHFSFAEKLLFFQFAGFYCLQCVLLAYLCLSCSQFRSVSSRRSRRIAMPVFWSARCSWEWSMSRCSRSI